MLDAPNPNPKKDATPIPTGVDVKVNRSYIWSDGSIGLVTIIKDEGPTEHKIELSLAQAEAMLTILKLKLGLQERSTDKKTA